MYHDRVFCIFVEWLRGAFHNGEPITWGTLVTVLHKAGITDEAQIIRESSR